MAKYRISFKSKALVEDQATVMVRGEVEIRESKAYSYGNSRCMAVNLTDGIQAYDVYDIRYDTSYRRDKEVDYIRNFIKEAWTGNRCKAQYIKVVPVFSLAGEN